METAAILPGIVLGVSLSAIPRAICKNSKKKKKKNAKTNLR
jgi:hypothetical protein